MLEVERVRAAGRTVLAAAVLALLGASLVAGRAATWVFAASSLLVPGALWASAAPRRRPGRTLAVACGLSLLLEAGGLGTLAGRGWVPWAALVLAPLGLVPLAAAWLLGPRDRESGARASRPEAR